MEIGCDSCTVRPRACGGCVLARLVPTGGGRSPVRLAEDEQVALAALARAGLLPVLAHRPRAVLARAG